MNGCDFLSTTAGENLQIVRTGRESRDLTDEVLRTDKQKGLQGATYAAVRVLWADIRDSVSCLEVSYVSIRL